MGLSLSQTAPDVDPECQFSNFASTLRGAHPEITHRETIFNDPSVIPYSKNCLIKSLDGILSSPIKYIDSRINEVFSTFMMTPSDYKIVVPKNFKLYPRHSCRPVAVDEQGSYAWWWLVQRAIVFVFNVVFVITILASPWIVRERELKDTMFVIIWVSLLLFVVGYVVNGQEQERMRYTLHFAIFLVSMVFARNLVLKTGGFLSRHRRLIPFYKRGRLQT